MDCVVAPQVILARHDRKNALQIKHYNRSNANISAKPIREIRSRDSEGVSTIRDFDWSLPTTIKQCQDSVLNFGAINRMLWPLDNTNISMMLCLAKPNENRGLSHFTTQNAIFFYIKKAI